MNGRRGEWRPRLIGLLDQAVSVAPSAVCVRCLLTFSVLALCPVGLASAPSPRWQLQRPPLPAGRKSSVLDSVSCTSRAKCMAVGSYINEARTLAERWNGLRWTIQPGPNSARWDHAVLVSVSCTSGASCVAVGTFQVKKGEESFALVERWNGSRWQIERSPSAQGITLYRVSCTSGKFCMAVGLRPNGATVVPFAEHWDGKHWSRQTTAALPAHAFSQFNAVSCTSRSSCMAVGSTDGGIAGCTVTALVEHWNGTRWSLDSIPCSHPWRDQSSLAGVSCTSSNACVALGSYGVLSAGGARRLPYAMAWNGARWSLSATAPPGDSDTGELGSVSCATRTACLAIGYHRHGTQRRLPLVERWNGSTWSITPVPFRGSANDVSCTRKTCTVVGTTPRTTPFAASTISPAISSN
jgi:hypothetical protein